ncbi:MAG: hypothetical protein KAU62_13200 [Candidatus Heimdallarchaeota archaeon]|nr:amidohydrolase [Candidatus Heimdallarchaeota archaeon]MCG3257048.1 hypothetical protein [Candidatus Heimdallarchaeota archaeon]MCK4612108.1 hypothetical protein [Candidatus Heimdallarchaeota archaeon]
MRSENEINAHLIDFAKVAISDYGQNQMIFAAKALAMTAINVLTNPELVSKMREEFKQEE